jgi:hypothetical protein
MAHGGARPGAGRKIGAATAKTREIADRAAAEGITPLEVMLEAMRSHYDAGRLDDAAEKAKDAAPYVHARLQAVQVGGDPGNPLKIERIERAIIDPPNRDSESLPPAA